MTNTIEYFKEQFKQVQAAGKNDGLDAIRLDAFNTFSKLGIPAAKHEEWKYTRIGGLFTKEYKFPLHVPASQLTAADVDALRLPGHKEANELFFVNGRFSSELSVLRSQGLVVSTLEEAATNEYKDIVANHLGHSGQYLKDGINSLNTAFVHGGIFMYVRNGLTIEHPVYIYHITDARSENIFSQPRALVYISANAQVQVVETFATLGSQESFTNQVMEIVVETGARAEHYKIQNDAKNANLVSTTHIRQTGNSYTHAVTITLNGGIVRNNGNVVLEAAHCEAHLYGLYCLQGQTHVDNHTMVDNVKPNCQSNELYKGILDGSATGVFNGKIIVQQQAQKTNAYQSNKNVLLSDTASINTKPQLEIFADDVKCSHGCTIGRLDEEGLFYLQSRGIPEKIAKSLLLQSFAIDILEQIKLPPVRAYVDALISKRLELV